MDIWRKTNNRIQSVLNTPMFTHTTWVAHVHHVTNAKLQKQLSRQSVFGSLCSRLNLYSIFILYSIERERKKSCIQWNKGENAPEKWLISKSSMCIIHPVFIRVNDECNTMHPVNEFRMKWNTVFFSPFSPLKSHSSDGGKRSERMEEKVRKKHHVKWILVSLW